MSSGDSFEKRASTLEDAFFHRVDQELLDKMRQESDRQALKDAMAKACDWADATLIDSLTAARITPESLVALSLVPLIHVAWADRRMEMNERDAVLQAARDNGCGEGTVGYQLLHSWLEDEPPSSLFEAWKQYTSGLCKRLDPQAKAALRKQVIGQARAVATSAGGILGIGSISGQEAAALRDAESVFEE